MCFYKGEQAGPWNCWPVSALALVPSKIMGQILLQVLLNYMEDKEEISESERDFSKCSHAWLITYLLQQWQLRSSTWTSLRPLIDSPLTSLAQNWRGMDGKLDRQELSGWLHRKSFSLQINVKMETSNEWRTSRVYSVLGKTPFNIVLSAPACGMECPLSRFVGDSKLSWAWMGLREGMLFRGTWTGLGSGPMRTTWSSTRPSANVLIYSLFPVPNHLCSEEGSGSVTRWSHQCQFCVLSPHGNQKDFAGWQLLS